ncbi:hypothetical protein DM02DRAFT_734466 [Periconia macrospinosa]|uniref:Uncharacterized protein n=1 Tax=Periconia macrospinosa TaxID=97972 RepID=A0A2V1D0B5_9PLEO|nr:hypothetical protein DM02DRAFT_734466 [Periconia macrospinosa]
MAANRQSSLPNPPSPLAKAGRSERYAGHHLLPPTIWLPVLHTVHERHSPKASAAGYPQLSSADTNISPQRRKTGQYWRVDHTQTNSIASVEVGCEDEQGCEAQVMRLEEEGCRDPDMAELLRMEDEEEHRLANEAHANASLPDRLEHDENTHWLHARRLHRLHRGFFAAGYAAGVRITALFRSSYQSDKLLGENIARTATASFAMSFERGSGKSPVKSFVATASSIHLPPRNHFRLLVLFWTDASIDGDPGAKAVIHFSGVLGIHPYKLTLRTAYDYTPYLSALIWVGRLVILEYALPSQAYSSWDPPLQARATYPDQESRLLREIRPRYLQRGTFAPLGYLIERLQHGRAIAKREGARTNISWSPDGQLLEVNRSQITLVQLRSTVYSLLDRINQEACELMFHWWPDVNLHRIKDKVTSYRSGYSFLEEPENNLQISFSAADCSKSLEQATPDCPIRLQLGIYRHVAVAISKKHIPALLEPFDPNIPKDQNGFLHLLAFQTGHTPSIHASAYALERGYPARLQPELIDRYFENSFIWHRFLGIAEERPINKEIDTGTFDQQTQKMITLTTKPTREVADVRVSNEESVVLGSGDQEIAEARRLGYSPDVPTPRTPERGTPELSDVDSSDEISPARTQERRQLRGKKRRRGTESGSPMTKKIRLMQRQLNDLLEERAASKRTRASHQRTSREYGESDSATDLETSDWEDMMPQETGANFFPFRPFYLAASRSVNTHRLLPRKKGWPGKAATVPEDEAKLSRNVELLKALVDEQLDLNNLEHEVKGKTYGNHATKAEVSPWLDMTRWPRYFDSLNMEEVAPLAYTPNPITEPPLVILSESLDRIIEQAHQSIREDKISVFDQANISNFLTNQATRHDRMIMVKLRKETFRAYKTLWKRLLAFVYRTSQPSH